MQQTQHIIQKVVVEVNVTSMATANRLKNNLNAFLIDRVFPQLEKELELLGLPIASKILRIPKLEVETATTTGNHFDFSVMKTNISSAIVAALQKEMAADTPAELIVTQRSPNDSVECLFYFLQEGRIPWWHAGKAKTIDFELIIKSAGYLRKEKSRFAVLLKSERVQERLISQISPNVLLRTLEEAFPKLPVLNALELSFLQFGTPSGSKVMIFWKNLIQGLIGNDFSSLVRFFAHTVAASELEDIEGRIQNQYWSEIYEKLYPVLPSRQKNQKPKFSQQPYKEQFAQISDDKRQGYGNEEDFYVENAGLMLIHPFLVPFFRENKLLDSHNGIKDKNLAVHLLHYLATKREFDWENSMAFEKFLCGVPSSQSIYRKTKIPKKFKAEAEDLLRSVLQNWEVLKNASPDLLRNEFLQRPGKISFTGNHPKITIEHKPQDILMAKIPWTIGVCKLPWLEGMIFTDWQS